MRGALQAEDCVLHYVQYGAGPRPVVCFHGYSNAATLFAPLQPLLGAGFTVYSIELPHHGGSVWPGGAVLSPHLLAAFVQQLAARHSGRKLGLAAFSLGGRAALSLMEAAPALVGRAVLVAPDGLGYHPLYRLLTRTAAGRALFGHFTEKPARYLSLLHWLRRKKLIDAGRFHFASCFIQTESARTFLKNVWLDLRVLMPNLRRVRRIIATQRISVLLIMGRNDPVIPPRQAIRFARGAPGISVAVLNKGHRLMDADTFARIAAALKSD